MNKVANFIGEAKKKTMSLAPYGTERFLSSSGDFLNSNTLISKATFLLLIIIMFVSLFYLFSKLIIFAMTPTDNPYIVKGMKDATQAMTIPQTYGGKTSIPIFRSKNENDGVEFTYSFWIYVNDLVYNENQDFKHVFHKGSSSKADSALDGVYGPNNAPGVYLYTGKKNVSDNLLDKFPLLGMLVRMNVFHDNDDKLNPYKYYDDIYVDAIPIKKWVNVVIRATGQNIVDVYINGTLTKRHKLSNIVKQNYDNLHINLNGGFGGNLSNLKYYNYAIGTFEIHKITRDGPDLTVNEESGLKKAKPYYLSPEWYFDNTDPLTN